MSRSSYYRHLLAACLLHCVPAVTALPAQGTSPTAGNQQRLTVMTWNLEWFFDDISGDNYSKLAREKTAPNRPAWAWHRDAIAKSISKAKPTILALQEVESRRILWYLTQALERNHQLDYEELGIESKDHFTEQDVGIIFRAPADVLSATQLMQTKSMSADKRYYNVSKHLMAVFQFPVGNDVERVIVINIHLRSRPEGEELRMRQARLIHHWIKDTIAGGENVIVLGDTNTEERGDTTRIGSDLAVLCGRETESVEDDLYDLHLKLSRQDRQTHLLADRQFDRILVSKSLLEDDPTRRDLVFEKIEVLPELAIQGKADGAEEHWEQFWKLPASERDLSDHYPVQATFIVQ